MNFPCIHSILSDSLLSLFAASPAPFISHPVRGSLILYDKELIKTETNVDVVSC